MEGIASPWSLVLSLLRGLCGEVHPELRQASIEADEEARVVRLRFEYDGEAVGPARESCTCAATEVIGDFPSPWNMEEQHVATRATESLSALKHVVYRRWEPSNAV
jgi:hypothetical protein